MIILHNPGGVFPPYRCYGHAVAVGANVRLRMKYLGAHRPALTVVCCRLLDPQWKLEMEAMAAR
jgi:enamine deaminase RidA (YjgF/YER057c/UK114 family)